MHTTLADLDGALWQQLDALAESAGVVVFTGIPGVGKSLLVRELAECASRRNRAIDLLQWDIARRNFESPTYLARYPEVNGVTDPVVRQAVGHWARSAVVAWRKRSPDHRRLLIVEAPVIGDRLVELTMVRDDMAEAILSAADTHFIVPVPSMAVREAIENARAQSVAQPQHDRERSDARVNVLQAIWLDVVGRGEQLGLVPNRPRVDRAYDPELYLAVYRRLLGARRTTVLPIATVLPKTRSVYDFHVPVHDVTASEDDVARSFAAVDTPPAPVSSP